MKQLKDLNEINLENVSPQNLYCLGVKSYHFHWDIYETDYYYYIYYNGEFMRVSFDIFKQILNKFGYDIKEERYHYQIDIIDTTWKNDYKDNFIIVYDKDLKNTYECIYNEYWLKNIFKIR